MANRWESAPVVEPRKKPMEGWRAAPVVGAEGDHKGRQPRHLNFEESLAAIAAEESNGTGAFLNNAVDGVPIAGPYLKEGVERAAAGATALTSDASYDDALKQIKLNIDAENEAHPRLATTGRVTGGVLGTVGMVGAAPTAFGAGEAGLLARSGISALSGGAVGAADSAVRSNGNLKDMAYGGGLGLLFGAAGPAVGQAVGAGVRYGTTAVQRLAEALRLSPNAAAEAGMSRPALETLRRAVTADGFDPAALSGKLDELGPDAVLADVGPNLREQAGAIVATPGKGQQVIRSALEGRAAGANSRIGGAVEENLGPRVIPSQVEQGIEEGQKAELPRVCRRP